MEEEDKKFVERRSETDSKRIVNVIFVENFYPNKIHTGKLYEITEDYISIIVDASIEQEIKFYIPKSVLLKFKFGKDFKTSISQAFVFNISKFVSSFSDESKKNTRLITMKFDALNEEDKENINKIIQTFGSVHNQEQKE